MVIVKSGVKIREAASRDSKSIGSIAYGEMAQVVYDKPEVADSVDGMRGKWINVKVGKASGFIFDAYLANLQKRNEKLPEHYPQLFNLEIGICGYYQYFNTSHYWYGVFEVGDTYRVELVSVDFSVKAENYQDNEYNRYIKINLNTQETPLFLIGHADSIANYSFDKNEFMKNAKHIYPGQRFDVTRTPAEKGRLITYTLSSSGSLGENEPVQAMKNYGISLSGNNENQNIMKNIEQTTLNEILPIIKFIGDLNNDRIPDIVLTSIPTWSSSYTYLLMSGHHRDKILTPVAITEFHSCY